MCSFSVGRGGERITRSKLVKESPSGGLLEIGVEGGFSSLSAVSLAILAYEIVFFLPVGFVVGSRSGRFDGPGACPQRGLFGFLGT